MAMQLTSDQLQLQAQSLLLSQRAQAQQSATMEDRLAALNQQAQMDLAATHAALFQTQTALHAALSQDAADSATAQSATAEVASLNAQVASLTAQLAAAQHA